MFEKRMERDSGDGRRHHGLPKISFLGYLTSVRAAPMEPALAFQVGRLQQAPQARSQFRSQGMGRERCPCRRTGECSCRPTSNLNFDGTRARKELDHGQHQGPPGSTAPRSGRHHPDSPQEASEATWLSHICSTQRLKFQDRRCTFRGFPVAASGAGLDVKAGSV